MGTRHVQDIAKHHDVKNFASARPELNDYLQRYARQNHDRGGARTYVLVDADNPKKILGYYSLVATEIASDHVPPELRKGLGRYPVPGFRLARLAVDRSFAGQGYGGFLFYDAAQRCLAAAQIVGAKLMVIDAKDDEAARYYLRFGAKPLPNARLTLVLPWESILK